MVSQDQTLSRWRGYFPLVIQLLILAVAPAALFGNFLNNALVFDDFSFFPDPHPELLQTFFSFALRWLPHASFEWTRALFGEGMVWLRLGNLGLHLANAFLLFLLLRKLFATVLTADDALVNNSLSHGSLPLDWLAFFGALIFAIHPVAVYGVAYLVQRTTLMATMFALLTWLLFLEGVIRGQQRWLLASVPCYLLAVLAKEHAIMAPAVAAAVLFLLRKPERRLFSQVGVTFVLYAMVGALVVFYLKSQVIGAAYEPSGEVRLAALGLDGRSAYLLSTVTQSLLFFKYLGLWLFPNPAWMSVYMLERFATQLWSWPETAGLVLFVGYGVGAVWLLRQRKEKGLFGFAMLFPWLLFFTELSSVRIQEVFVLYRSYLWMPGIFAALPLLFRKIPVKYGAGLLVMVVLVLIPASWNRLTVFTDPERLWEDALQLAQPREALNKVGLSSIYYDCGIAKLNKHRYPEAIRDFDEAIRLEPQLPIFYTNRALAHLKSRQYDLALSDCNMAIQLNPGESTNYRYRSTTYQMLGDSTAAQLDYSRSLMLAR